MQNLAGFVQKKLW